jgi:hypothetical protein
LSFNIEISFLPRKSLQADLFTFSILVFLGVGLGTFEDDLTLSLGNLNFPQLANVPSKCTDWRKATQGCMIQSRKMVFDRLHRLQTRLTFVRQGSLSSTCSDASIFLLNHSRTFFFSAWAASRSAWVFSCVFSFLSNDSGTRTWSFVGTLLLVLESPVIVMGVCTFQLRWSTCPNLNEAKGCVPEKSH